MSAYGYRIEVYEYDVDGEPCNVSSTGSEFDEEALAEAHNRLASGASSVVIQLVTTWRQL